MREALGPDRESLTLWRRNEVSQWLLTQLLHRRRAALSRLAVERDLVALHQLQGEVRALNQMLEQAFSHDE